MTKLYFLFYKLNLNYKFRKGRYIFLKLKEIKNKKRQKNNKTKNNEKKFSEKENNIILIFILVQDKDLFFQKKREATIKIVKIFVKFLKLKKFFLGFNEVKYKNKTKTPPKYNNRINTNIHDLKKK